MAHDVLIVLIIFASLFGIIFVAVSARNRERMAMIENGTDLKTFQHRAKPSVYGILKWALLLVGLGLGLFIGNLFETYSELSEVAVYFASTLFFGGLGLLGAFVIQRAAEKKDQPS
ncbi:MAG: DUF6249 domain-containing protein [Bacteroidales bacterium]